MEKIEIADAVHHGPSGATGSCPPALPPPRSRRVTAEDLMILGMTFRFEVEQ